MVRDGGLSSTFELPATANAESSMYCSDILCATTMKNTINRKTTSIIGVKSGLSLEAGG
jgi:hypothetical protein